MRRFEKLVARYKTNFKKQFKTNGSSEVITSER